MRLIIERQLSLSQFRGSGQWDFIFGCEARLDIERIPLNEDSLKH
ncbi:hypothetical protein ALT1545_90008 [Alteromonas macleodii]